MRCPLPAAGCSSWQAAALEGETASLPGEGSLAGTSAKGLWPGARAACAMLCSAGASLALCGSALRATAAPAVLSMPVRAHLPSARCACKHRA